MSDSKIVKSLEFLKKDLEKAQQQWRGGQQFMSLPQRSNMDLSELVDLFDPKPDENAWAKEYAEKKRSKELVLMRTRMAFLKASRKEFHEEYDDDVTDVDFMRLLELPFTDPKYAIEHGISALG